MENEFPRRAHVSALISVACLLLGICCSCAKSGNNQDASSGRAPGVPAVGRLSQDDVDLYMETMRAASVRVMNLLPADEATLARMKKLQDDIEAGRIPTPMEGDPAAEVLQRGMKLQHAMDEIIAEEKQIDIGHYTAVRDLIEKIVNPSDIAPDESDQGMGKPMTPAEAQTLLANKRILAPQVPEIERLYQVVRLSLAEKSK